ncbi:MAG: class I SAM-dependent methyltransferase [Planctomycetia bacterium]|nr:class I SAM-dependent methyltransferase [Planctomycetia bacterium]
MDPLKKIARWKAEMILTAAEPYRAAGRFAWHFARGKLGGDPVFTGLLEHGLIPAQARILDLGCGQGLLAAWLRAANAMYSARNWPRDWPIAPTGTTFRGIELMPRDVRRAEVITGHGVVVEEGDIRTADFGSANLVVILDVLHYMDFSAQDDVLRRVRAALTADGTLLLRVGNAAAGWPFRISNWVDFMAATARGHRLERLYCRTLDQWTHVLESLGLTVKSVPMSQGTPFANVLMVASVASA